MLIVHSELQPVNIMERTMHSLRSSVRVPAQAWRSCGMHCAPLQPSVRHVRQQGAASFSKRLISQPHHVGLRRARGPMQVVRAASDTLQSEAPALKRIGWISFWTQLSLAVVSAIILSFAVSASMQGSQVSPSVYATLFGVIVSFISTFMAYGNVKIARRVFANESVSRENVVASLLRSTRLNLIGMGATLVGLQSTTGVLLAKTLTSSSTNPYQAGAAATRAAPAALDVFSVQAAANTLLAHFAAMVFANWLLRIVNQDAAPAKMSSGSISSGSGGGGSRGKDGGTLFPKPT